MIGLLATLALVGCTTRPVAPADPVGATEARPNVVLVTLDTTRADHLGTFGWPGARTDAVDALAARGRSFRRAYAPVPLTIPSHATMFTGMLPPHHQIRSNGGGVLGPDAVTLAEVLRDAGWNTGAAVAAFVTQRRWGLDQGFDAYLDDVPADPDDFWHGERRGDLVVDDALAWKAAQSPTAPLFLWVHLYDAHAPYAPPDRYLDPASPRPYDGELAFVDDQVGRLVEAFAGTPTLFVIAGDHGESLGEHGEASHGMFAYTATQHVPWILAGPGVAPGASDEPVSLADLMPTVLDALHLPIPTGLDGVVRPSSTRPPVYVESWQLAQRFGIAPHVGLIDDRWALLATPRPELYDLVADPDEKTDVAAAHPDVVARLKARLDALAMPAPTSADGAVATGAGAELAALGYVEPASKVDLSGPLPDPKDHPELVGRLGQVERALRTGDLPTAEAVLRALIAHQPAVVEHRSRLAAVLARAHRFDEARSVVEDALAIDPGNPRLGALRAAQLASLGRYAEAADGFREAALAMPYDPRLRAATIAAMRHAGQRMPAIALGETWRATYPDDDRLAGALGIALVQAGDPATGVPLLEQGLKADPPELEVAYHLSAVRVAAGRLGDGLDLLVREVDAWPGNTHAAAIGARLALYLERWEVMHDMAARALARETDDPSLWHLETLALFNLGRFDEARVAVARGLTVDATNPDLLLMDANLLAKAGDREQGRARFEQAKAALATRRADGLGPASIVDELAAIARGGDPAASVPPRASSGR